MYSAKNIFTLPLSLLCGTVLIACAQVVHQYEGEQLPENKVAMILGMGVVAGEGSNPDVVLSPWKLNGEPLKGDIIRGTRGFAVLPGKQEVGITLNLVTSLIVLRQFSGTYWVPFEAEPGFIYQFYATSDNGGVPKEVCALRTTRPLTLSEDMEMPDGAKLVGCGKPKEPIETYTLRRCMGIGSCPVSDEYVKP